MDMTVGKAGHGRTAIQIDYLGGGTGQGLDGRGGAHRHNLAIPHRHCLGDAIVGVHRQNSTIDEQ
jgi:hypothetical protein